MTRGACKGCKEALGVINEGLHLLKGIEEGGRKLGLNDEGNDGSWQRYSLFFINNQPPQTLGLGWFI